MLVLLWVLGFVVLLGALAYFRAPGWLWVALAAGSVVAFTLRGGSPGWNAALWTLLVLGAALVLVRPLRRALLSDPLLHVFRKALPHVSQTEQEALEAGTVWWDGEFFSGKPDWRKILAFKKPALSVEEQAFIDGPVEELCRMCDDWEVSYELNDLPPHVWQYIKDAGFLGIIIPRQYGGLGFSAFAHSQIVMKLGGRCPTACVSVMVPNSLGPAELLLHYGTEQQKIHYLPRLAKGLEMPCFALTGPEAGSDAGAIPDFGIVCRGMHEGKEVLGMRLTWEKRYITLGPVATLLGLAFKLYDPDRLLGGRAELGITLALISTSHPGVNIGRRHFPLNGSFMNGPNSGKDVFIPLDWIIGGQAYAGQGWRMLMECLAAGRSISLPSSTTGGAKTAVRTTGAYSRVRSQFKVAIGKFEGVEEALARMGGNLYVMDAARGITAAAVDAGEKPSVISAVVKYHCTERARHVLNDAMDVHGGKGICLGPNNYIGRGYQQIPISITVEGANILTRSMIIFGQGGIRAHPYVLREIAATREADSAKASRDFDAALWGHVSFVITNAVRSLWLALSGARFVSVPGTAPARAYLRQLERMSASFALASDVAMLFLGGALKRRESLSARLGDVLSHLYLASCTVKHWHDEGCQAADLPLMEWGVQDALAKAQDALAGLLRNFPVRPAAWLLRLLVFPWGRRYSTPGDQLSHRVARLLIEDCPARDRLTAGMFLWKDESDPVGRLEVALGMVAAAEQVEAKLRAAAKGAPITAHTPAERIANGVSSGVISAREGELLTRFYALRRACIMVDDFPNDVGRHVAEQPAVVEPIMTRKSA